MSVNKVILVGRIGQDPEARYTPSGTAVTNLRLATSESWKDQSGERQEKTEWHTIVAWGKLAEICSQYLTKGRLVYFEGRLETRSWQDREGNTRYTTEVRANNMVMLGGKGEVGSVPPARQPSSSASGPPSAPQSRSWQDRQGNTRYTPEGRAGNTGRSSDQGEAGPGRRAPQPSSPASGPPSVPQTDDDDIPF